MAKKINSGKKAKVPKKALPPSVPPSIAADYGLSTTWLDLSDKIPVARTEGNTVQVSKDLASAAKKYEGSPLQPFFSLWQADNESFSGNYRQALPLYEKSLLAAGKEGRFLESIKLLPHLLEQYAATAVYSGNHKEAASLYKQLQKNKDKDEASMLIAAKYFEGLGDYTNATAFYKEAVGKNKATMHPTPAQFAIRALQRMNAPETYFPSVAQLKDRILTALAKKNTKLLESLLSKSHCSLTLGGGHMHFIDDKTRISLLAELKDSSGEVVRSHMGMGEKCYIYLNGFNGKLMKGDVGLLLTKSAYGWQWSGFILPIPPDQLHKNSGPVKAANNIILPFPIKAPWPAGESFMAGGLSDYILEQAIVSASGPIGAIAMAARPQGFGLRGFYYDNYPTHDDNDYYAIDFTRYRQYVPYENISGGTPVLAVADGKVTGLRGSITSGNSGNHNYVQVDHLDPLTGIERFYSRYLHLSGPSQLSVSIGLNIRRGCHLGKMNDTGTSVMDHLHFSIHDKDAGNQSIKPSPMDGVTLDEDDSGKLVLSTNIIGLPPLWENAMFIREQAPPATMQRGQTFNASVTMRNMGGNRWPSSYVLLGQPGLGVTEVTINRPVPARTEITINFQIVALFPGDYNYRWQMGRSSTDPFGQSSPLHRIRIGIGGGGSCSDINRDIENLEVMLDLYQQMLTENPANKAELLRMVRNTVTHITALERQKERLGCN